MSLWPVEGGKPFGGCGDGGGVGEVPGEVPCPGAATRPSMNFVGASEDGSKVFFMTAPSSGGGLAQRDLYMASIGCPAGEEGCEVAKKEVRSMAQVSQDVSPGRAAEVQGVLRVSPDGSRVYFVAHGVLSEGANAEGEGPVSGADNLYVYDSVTGERRCLLRVFARGMRVRAKPKISVVPVRLRMTVRCG